MCSPHSSSKTTPTGSFASFSQVQERHPNVPLSRLDTSTRLHGIFGRFQSKRSHVPQQAPPVPTTREPVAKLSCRSARTGIRVEYIRWPDAGGQDRVASSHVSVIHGLFNLNRQASTRSNFISRRNDATLSELKSAQAGLRATDICTRCRQRRFPPAALPYRFVAGRPRGGLNLNDTYLTR